MQLTSSFLVLLQQFTPIFTEPTFRTFVQVVNGWILSHRHRFVTEIIFAGGKWDTFRMLTHPGIAILPAAFAADVLMAAGAEGTCGVLVGATVGSGVGAAELTSGAAGVVLSTGRA